MLTARPTPFAHRSGPGRQRGLVLILALIVLAAMSLAAIGLMRGVLGSNRVAGNLSYQQAAIHASDVSMETAVAWLEQRTNELEQRNAAPAPMTAANKLYGNIAKGPGEPYAYSATRADPGPSQTWESFWPTMETAGLVNTLAADAQGNTASFVVQRLCALSGAPKDARCESAPTQKSAVENSSKGPGGPKPKEDGQVYYRITVRVVGPRNAVSIIQTMVAI